MTFIRRLSIALAAAAAVGGAQADSMDRPVGIMIGQRMSLKPYVALSASYDSNVEGRSYGSEDVIWALNPHLALDWRSESVNAIANVWYQYNGYTKGHQSNLNSYHSYGEDVTFRWTDSLPGEKGWSVMASEKFQFINQLDNMTDSLGREYGRDRQEFKAAGSVQRRFNEKLHANLNGNLYWLEYDHNNQQNLSYGLYGWDRWGIGAEAGYAFSRWTDLIIAGSYQRYNRENRDNNYYTWHTEYPLSAGNSGWTAQVGLGSFATERLTYRVLGGWSTYDYDQGGESSGGYTYTASANWIISETWKSMFLATSHFQPTEREYGSSQRVDSISWGLTHSMVQGKLHSTFDLAYRREGREYTAVSSYDYDLDILQARLGCTYILNRYLQLFGNLEYRLSKCENDDSLRGGYYDYDRFRATLGLRFTY